MNTSLSGSNSTNINILIVIDTDYIKENYPNPSKDPSNPTGINHNSQFMICNSSRGIISGQGTADLNFKANSGDYVSFSGISIYGNSDDAIIVYGIKHWNGDSVFQNFTIKKITIKQAILPNPNSPYNNGLPAKNSIVNFIFYKSKVINPGIENFYVKFALYNLSNDGNTQQLFGYYYWDPTITIQ